MKNLSRKEINATRKVKLFQYLDIDKMYSISSQIFEGLTDYVINSSENLNEDSTTQKGEFGSGKVLAEIIEESTGTTEKRFLHDYSYNLFEDALIRAGRVLDINEYNITEVIGSINEKGFIKVTGKVLFNDVNRLIHSLKNFNEFGYAVWYVTQGKDLVKTYKEEKNKANKIIDRNKKASTLSRIEGVVNFKELLDDAGLYLDPENLEHMAYLLNYGYEGQFEVQLPITQNEDNYLFSAQLKREMLKESEELLIRKYSRETERHFTIFGILTQTQGEKLDSRQSSEGEVPLKQAMMNFVSALTKLEDTFTGRLSNRVVAGVIVSSL